MAATDNSRGRVRRAACVERTSSGLGAPLRLALVRASGRCRRRHTRLMKSLSGMRTPALRTLWQNRRSMLAHARVHASQASGHPALLCAR